VVFKRRKPRTWTNWAKQMVYPDGGFRRATRYVVHRMQRLPDRPHRIARGVFAGSFIGFMPLPGLQFLGAAGFAWTLRGNILAALLATFNSNPITTPFFAVGAIALGHWILGIEAPLSYEYVVNAFAHAGSDLWANVKAIFTEDTAHWEGLKQFWRTIYLPYFIGALIPGLALSALFYYITIPLVDAYQRARAAKAKDRAERRRKLRSALADAASRLRPKTEREGDDAGDETP
jgi:uncharacterized protein